MPAENDNVSSWGLLCLQKMRYSMLQWDVTSQSSGMVLLGVHAHQAKQGMTGAGQERGEGGAGQGRARGGARGGAGARQQQVRGRAEARGRAGQGQGQGKAHCKAPEDKPELCRSG